MLLSLPQGLQFWPQWLSKLNRTGNLIGMQLHPQRLVCVRKICTRTLTREPAVIMRRAGFGIQARIVRYLDLCFSLSSHSDARM